MGRAREGGGVSVGFVNVYLMTMVQTSTPEELREFLSSHVARWQLPERWSFIEAVPKTSVGKFDKKVLRKQYAEEALEVTTLPSPSA